MSNRQLQGWSADPFGLHEERYFSAGRPTKLVRDGKVESYEDPPSDTYADEPETEAFAPAPAVAAPGWYAPGGPPQRADVSGQDARADPGAAQGVRRRPRALLIVAAVAIVAATVAGMIVLVKQESRATPNPNRPTSGRAWIELPVPQSQSSSLVGSMVTYVSNYGAPVQITAPPSSQVISWDSFLKALGTKA
jgi:hypothetical protein